MLSLAAWAWFAVPDDAFPVHLGFDGKVQTTNSRFVAFGVLPLLATILQCAFMVRSRVETRAEHLERSAKPLAITWLGILLALATVQAAFIALAAGHLTPENLGAACIAGASILHIASGNYLPKSRSNHTIGVRTRWTLASETSWSKTNRLGGQLLMAQGVVCLLVLAQHGVATATWCLIGGDLVVTIVTSVYSYLTWRDDPTHAET